MFAFKRRSSTQNKKKWTIPSVFTIIFALLLIIVVISWIPGVVANHPVTIDKKTYYPHQLGIFDAVRALFQGIMVKGGIIAFVFAIGAYIYKVLDSGALEAGVGHLLKRLKGKEIYLIPVCILFFGFGGTVYNMAEETVAYYPVLIPVLMFAGFDVMTTILVITFGAGMGVLGSTLGPFSNVIAANTLHVNTFDGIIWRLLIFLVAMGVTIAFTMWYAQRVRHHPEKSILAYRQAELKKEFGHYKELPPLTKKRKAILAIFVAVFIIMVLMELPWGTFFGISGDKFGTFSSKTGTLSYVGYFLNKYFPYLTTGFLSDTDGGIFLDLAVLFFFATLVIGLINWKGEEKFVNDYIIGAKDLLGVSLIIAAAGGVTILLDNNHTGLGYTIGQGIANGVQNLNAAEFVVITFLAFIPLSFLIPSTSGFATAILPLFGKAAGDVHAKSGMITAYINAEGFINLFTPAGLPMACLMLAKVNYKDFLKGTWPLILAAFLIPLILLPIGAEVGSVANNPFVF